LEAASGVLALDPDNLKCPLAEGGLRWWAVSPTGKPTADLNALSKLQPDSQGSRVGVAALAAGEKRLRQSGGAVINGFTGLVPRICVRFRNCWSCAFCNTSRKGPRPVEGELRQDPNSRPVRLFWASVATQEGKFLISRPSNTLASIQGAEIAHRILNRRPVSNARRNQDALASYEKASNWRGRHQDIELSQFWQSQNGQARRGLATLNKQLPWPQQCSRDETIWPTSG